MFNVFRNPPQGLVFAMIILVMVIWSVNYLWAKTTLQEFDALTLASFRVTLAAVIMTGIFLARPRRGWPERRDAVKFAQLSFFGVVMNQVLFTLGLSLTTVSHSALLVGLGPVYVLLLAWMQGLESISPGKVAGMILAFSGVAVLATEHGFSLQSGTLAGDLITIGGSLSFSIYLVLGKKVARRYSTVEMNFFNYLIAAVMISPVALRQASLLDWRRISWTAWGGLLYMAAFASVAAYLIYFWALRHVTATRIAAFSYLLPVVATLGGVLVLGDALSGHLFVGGGLVLAGVFLAERAPAGDRIADEEQQTV
jgi:drug/metabolite transporter (DMT)-like permease